MRKNSCFDGTVGQPGKSNNLGIKINHKKMSMIRETGIGLHGNAYLLRWKRNKMSEGIEKKRYIERRLKSNSEKSPMPNFWLPYHFPLTLQALHSGFLMQYPTILN